MILALLMAAALVSTQPKVELPASSNCGPVAWAADGKNARAALTTQVVVNGQALTFQVDTGADESVIYAAGAKRLGFAGSDQTLVGVASLSAGGMKLSKASLFVNMGMTGDDGIDGTLGLQSLIGRVVVIDYPGRRLCILDETSVPDSLWTAPAWTSATIRNGKLFVPVQVGSAKLDDVAFDTGSSLFPLVVDAANWRLLTGKGSEEGAAQTLTGSSWGKSVSFAGDRAQSTMTIGKIKLAEPMVFTNADEASGFATWPFRIDGLIGNAPFWDGIIVLDLTVHARFGFIAKP